MSLSNDELKATSAKGTVEESLKEEYKEEESDCGDIALGVVGLPSLMLICLELVLGVSHALAVGTKLPARLRYPPL